MSDEPIRPRLPLLSDAEMGSEARAIVEHVRSQTGSVPNLYRMLAHAPELLEAWIAFAWPLRFDATSSRKIRELVILRTAQNHQADYEWRQHWRHATEAGVTAGQLEALSAWRDAGVFSPAEQAALALTDDLAVATEPTEATWSALRDQFDERQCLEMILTASFYVCVSRVLKSLRVPLEESAGDIPAVPQI